MVPNALKKAVVRYSAIAAIGTICVAAAGLSANAAQRPPTPPDQAVNGAAKTDRLELPDVVSTVVRTEKANRKLRSPKSEAEFKFEPTNKRKSVPNGGILTKRDVTTGSVDDAAAPVTRANDDPGAVVQPVANSEETSRNYSEEPTEKHPSSWSAWSYSKGLMERTDRRARFLWNRLVDR